MKLYKYAMIALMGLVSVSCSDDPKEDEQEPLKPEAGSYRGFYVLNQGNMGTNKCTLDFCDLVTGKYTRDIYSQSNPNEVLELGDTGNGMAIEGENLYIVVNGSHKIEVVSVADAVKKGSVNVSSPRSIVFDGDYGYVSSFVGGEGENGSIVRFNLKTLAVEGSVSVGIMPEGIAVKDGKLYVANSGDYADPAYLNFISVVDTKSMRETGRIGAPINLQHILFDKAGRLWVSSRGNYADIPSALYAFDAAGDSYNRTLSVPIPVSAMTLNGDEILTIGSTYDANWNATYSYETVGTADGTCYGSYLSDAMMKKISTPYTVVVDEYDGNIYVTDVKNYVSSGTLYMFNADGNTEKAHYTTGDIPCSVVFVK